MWINFISYCTVLLHSFNICDLPDSAAGLFRGALPHSQSKNQGGSVFRVGGQLPGSYGPAKATAECFYDTVYELKEQVADKFVHT